jgi:hypothetical protein
VPLLVCYAGMVVMLRGIAFTFFLK